MQDGTEVAVKEVLAGDSVHSLLSILDVITVSLLGLPGSHLDSMSLTAESSSPQWRGAGLGREGPLAGQGCVGEQL